MIYSVFRLAVMLVIVFPFNALFAQPGVRSGTNDQHVNYFMQIDFNAAENKF